LRALGEFVELERVAWVAHSLGTVFSEIVIAEFLDKAVQLGNAAAAAVPG